MISRLLIVGRGSIGTRHLEVARQLLPDAQIAVLGRRKEPKPSHADLAFSHIDEALKFGPQMAVIANPATMHIEPALALARSGAHVLIEKPIAASSKDVRTLIELCRDQKTVLMVGYNLRFSPSLIFFRDAVKQQLVGSIYSVRAEVGQNLEEWRLGDYRQSVSAQSALGGGALLELSHEVDYLRWLFGNVSWVNATLHRQSELEIDVEDTAHLTLGFAKQSKGDSIVAALNVDFIRHDKTRTCVAIGQNGTLRWDGISGQVDIFKKDWSSWQTIFAQKPEKNETYIAEWRHFFDCIDGQTPLVSGQDGLAVLQIVEAAKQSSAQGQTINVV